MPPILRAASVYELEECARSFKEDLALHLLYGYVFSTPDLFMMGRAVDKNAPEEEIKDPAFVFERPNAWLVHLAAGGDGPLSFLEHEPYCLPFIGWEKRNILRFYRREQLLTHAHSPLTNLLSGLFLQGRRFGPEASQAARPTPPHHGGGECGADAAIAAPAGRPWFCLHLSDSGQWSD